MTLNGRNLLSAQVIWDHDHGAANEGWYLRTRWEDGEAHDEQLNALDDEPQDTSHADLVSAAVLYLHDPDGMTDDERDELRAMIEVIR